MYRLLKRRPPRHSMRRLILMAMLLGILLFAGVGYLGLYSLFNIYHTEFARSQRELSESYYRYVEKCMDDAERLSLRIIADDSVQQCLRVLESGTGVQYAQAVLTMQDAVTAAVMEVSSLSYIRGVIVQDMKGSFYTSGGRTLDQALKEELASLIARTSDNGRIAWYALNWQDRPQLVLVRAIRESKQLSLEMLGYEVILVDFKTLLGHAETGSEDYAGGLETYLDGERFYRGDECPDVDVVLDEDEAWRIIRAGGTRYFVIQASFLGGRLTFVNYENYSRLTGVMTSALYNLLILLGLLVLLFTGFFLLVTKRIFNHLERLTEAVKNAPAGDFRVTLEEDLLRDDDEVGILARHFQNLMNRIDNLIHRELRGKLLTAQAQCRMLQAQIHPHFLYNTLETIYAMAERDGNKSISRITMSLSRLVRATYRSSMYVPLRQEIELVREYLAIYRIRFGQRLSAVIDYDPDDEDIMLPQMTLQPLVENSVRYGLMKKMERGVIRLRIRRRRGRLVISLFDNGTGFPQALVDEYNNLSLDEEMEIHGYKNVIYRLKYTYGDEAQARVRSREGHWTNLSIIIPDTLPDSILKEAEKNVQSASGGR